jgi:2-C-methyl-D-erythritol 4-phosphate cytidylyltransferase
MLNSAVITAGGIGKRMNRDIPKQYLQIGGMPIISRTIRIFDNHPLIHEIIVTLPKGQESYFADFVLKRESFQKRIQITNGGDTRQKSVYNGLSLAKDSEFVVIHDAVRPFVSPNIISKCIESAQITGAAIACVKIAETVKRVSGEFLETIPRHDLYLAHTPQVFKTRVILDAHNKAHESGYNGTDDASLLERLKLPVSLVEDEEFNIKITTPADLLLAEIILANQLTS